MCLFCTDFYIFGNFVFFVFLVVQYRRSVISKIKRLDTNTRDFGYSFYVVRLPVWCIKLSDARVILRSHKFLNHLLRLLPLPVLYNLTVFTKSKSSSSLTSKHGQSL